MFHSIFAATAAYTGVTPIMFGDEFGVRTDGNGLRFAGRAHLEGFPFAAASPRIFNLQPKVDVFDFMLHRQRQITLAIKRARHQRDGATRDKLPNENNSAPPAVSGFSTDIKAQVHFFEIPMQWNRQTEQSCIEKEKTDDADERLAVFVIDLSAGRDERRENARIDNVIEHGEITPARSEKWFHVRKFAGSTESRPAYRDQCRSFSSDGSGAVPSEVALA